MVKAIIFDFNGLFVQPIEKKIIYNICSLKGIGSWIARSNYYLNLWDFQKGFMDPKVFWKKVFVHLTDEEYTSLVEKEYEKRVPKNVDLYVMAEELSKKYDLYLLSNSNFLQGKSFRKQKLYAPFKELFLSHELHDMKPFPNIYKRFLAQTKLKAKDCVFVDDSTVNVGTAMLLGFKGIVYHDEDHLKEKFQELGILE